MCPPVSPDPPSTSTRPPPSGPLLLPAEILTFPALPTSLFPADNTIPPLLSLLAEPSIDTEPASPS